MIKFLEHRLGIFSAFRSSMSEKRPPRGIGFLRTIGFAALTVMVLQFLSGISLALHYIPTTDLAYDSIRAFENDLDFDGFAFGMFTRSLHHFGASAFVIFAVLHMVRVFFTGAYKRPREFTWLSGVGLLLIVLGFGFTGYLLPWDQKAYFATKVGTDIAADTPVIGATVREMLRGGTDVGQPTLTRFYIIHVVLLPIALLGVLGLHFYLIQRHSVAPPGLPVDEEGEKGLPYFPHHTFKEALVGILVAGGLFWVSYQYPAPLEALAEPSDTEYIPRPDWYFLGLFQLLKYFETNQAIGTFWIPAGFVTLLALLPFLDRTKARRWNHRWFMTPVGVLVCAAVVTLTYLGWTADDHRPPPTPKPFGENRQALDGHTLPLPLGYTNLERQGYLLTRRHKCMDCHNHVVGEDDPDKTSVLKVFGKINPDLSALPRLEDLGEETEDILAAFAEPPEDMPDYGKLPRQDQLAIATFVTRFGRDFAKAAAKKKAEQASKKKDGK